MDGIEDESRQGKEATPARLYKLQEEEGPLFWREAGLQALSQVEDTMRLQGHDKEGCTKDGLYGHAGQEAEKDGGPNHQNNTQGRI
jgi:hypothetical protein